MPNYQRLQRIKIIQNKFGAYAQICYICLINLNEIKMKTIKANETLTAKSICDSNCIFELQVIERKNNFATVKYMNEVRRIKVKINNNGNEYLKPDNYSMAPMFRAK